MPNTLVQAAAEGLPKINRRSFLGGVGKSALAAGIVASPAAASTEEAAPALTTLETVMWHLREIERLVIEDGARRYCVMVVGNNYPDRLGAKCIQLTDEGHFPGPTKGMFASKGGDA